MKLDRMSGKKTRVSAEEKERLETGNEGNHLMVNASNYMKDRVYSLPQSSRYT